MRKLLLLALSAFLSFTLCACSTKDTAIPMNVDDSKNLSKTDTEEPKISSQDLSSQAETIKNQYNISITDLSRHETYYDDEDKSPVLKADASYPLISIPGREETSDKINTAIEHELETFWNFEKQNADYARENYHAAAEDDGYTFDPYTASFSYTVKRCDKQIISIVFFQYDYSGGAHGATWQYGATFDAVTGNKLQLEALSNDFTDFYNILLTNLENQAQLPAYEYYIFEDFAADMETDLLKDSSVWYLDSSGITFISNPYVLGAYSAGTFEFNIPYRDLKGLKDSYNYSGSYVQKIFPGVSASYDINNDGREEEICYSIWDDEYNTVLSLTVNGEDFSGELDKLHIVYPHTGAYYLIDIDPEDDFIEIAITDDNYDAGKDFTHFFRYTREKDLTYLGNIPKIYHEGEIICYNSNGNLVLLNSDGTFAE